MNDLKDEPSTPGSIRRVPEFLAAPAPSVFEEAETIVNGDREQTYGHPAKNLHATALLWAAHIEAKYGIEVPLDCFDVAWMMANLKQARQMHMHKRDNLVDAIGYIGLDQKIRDYNERNGQCKNQSTASSRLASAQQLGSE
jgi:hypothetical protein